MDKRDNVTVFSLEVANCVIQLFIRIMYANRFALPGGTFGQVPATTLNVVPMFDVPYTEPVATICYYDVDILLKSPSQLYLLTIEMSNKRSIYGARAGGRSIYGGGSGTMCDATHTCLTTELLTAFMDMTVSVRHVVDLFFPAAHATSAYIAKMSAIGGIPAVYFVRLAWRMRHPGEIFTATEVQIGQIQDIYLEYDLLIDPTKDKLFAT